MAFGPTLLVGKHQLKKKTKKNIYRKNSNYVQRNKILPKLRLAHVTILLVIEVIKVYDWPKTGLVGSISRNNNLYNFKESTNEN